MDAIDKLIERHAAELQRTYDERIAGDSTFHGKLAKFLWEVDAARADEQTQPAVPQVGERVVVLAAPWCNSLVGRRGTVTAVTVHTWAATGYEDTTHLVALDDGDFVYCTVRYLTSIEVSEEANS